MRALAISTGMPARTGFVQHVGPELGLDEDQQARAQAHEATPYAARQIVGRVSHIDTGQQSAGAHTARGRGAGQCDLERMVALAQGLDQDGGHLHLAHRDRVHPDAAAGARRAETESRQAATPVLARAQAAPSTSSVANGSARYSSSV